MVTVLDAYSLIAFLRDELAAAEVATLLERPTVVSAANHAEVVDRLIRVGGQPQGAVEEALATLRHEGMAVRPVDEPCATAAGLLRARHYHRTRSSVSLADCIAAATAQREGLPLATADPALAAMVRAEGGDLIALPDRSGRRP